MSIKIKRHSIWSWNCMQKLRKKIPHFFYLAQIDFNVKFFILKNIWNRIDLLAYYFNNMLVGFGSECIFFCTSSMVSLKMLFISSIVFNMEIGTSSSRLWNSISPLKSITWYFRALNSSPTNLLLIRA